MRRREHHGNNLGQGPNVDPKMCWTRCGRRNTSKSTQPQATASTGPARRSMLRPLA